MQRNFTKLLTLPTPLNILSSSKLRGSNKHLLTVTMLALSVSISGCQTFKKLTDSDESTVVTASKTDAGYYSAAALALEEDHFMEASSLLSELRTFYPTGQYAEQALLDLMYAQFRNKEYELASNSAEQFIKLYPKNSQVDYAYYVRGIANMQTGTNTLLNISKQNLAHRDTSYMRLAFTNFQELLNRFPNSIYAADAAQRMSFIYNQFAENEMAAARWYIERNAYVAAANRAKWVFQYYPLSEQTPEAIATLAYSYGQLGITDLAQQYKTLLQINYPDWLTTDGQVRLKNKGSSSLLNKLTFGRLGRSGVQHTSSVSGSYEGKTKTQVIQRAAQLQLIEDQAAQSQTPKPYSIVGNRKINVGLGLPEADAEQIGSQHSSSQTAQNSVVTANDNVNPTRRATLSTPPDSALNIITAPDNTADSQMAPQNTTDDEATAPNTTITDTP